jgi:hypothetical protein
MPAPSTPEALAARLRGEIEKWGPIIKAAGAHDREGQPRVGGKGGGACFINRRGSS